MITVEQFIVQRLSNDAQVVALIGQRSYALLPQFDPTGINYPAVIYRLSDREREYTHDGQDPGVLSHFEIVCIAKRYADVVQVAGAVRKAFIGIKTDEVDYIQIEAEEDLPYTFEELQEQSLFVRGLALAIGHQEEV